MLTIVVAIPLAVLVRHLISPAYDPREPPVIKPKIPLIGHIISMVTEASGYYQRLLYVPFGSELYLAPGCLAAHTDRGAIMTARNTGYPFAHSPCSTTRST